MKTRTLYFFLLLTLCVSCNKYRKCEDATIPEKLVCKDGTWKAEVNNWNSGNITNEKWIFTKDNFCTINGKSQVWSFENKQGDNIFTIGSKMYLIKVSNGMSFEMEGWDNFHGIVKMTK